MQFFAILITSNKQNMLEPQLSWNIPYPFPYQLTLGFTICKIASADLLPSVCGLWHVMATSNWNMLFYDTSCVFTSTSIMLKKMPPYYSKWIMVWLWFDNKITSGKLLISATSAQDPFLDYKFEKGFPSSWLLIKNQEMKKYPSVIYSWNLEWWQWNEIAYGCPLSYYLELH